VQGSRESSAVDRSRSGTVNGARHGKSSDGSHRQSHASSGQVKSRARRKRGK
jgi:hypothetical protein